MAHEILKQNCFNWTMQDQDAFPYPTVVDDLEDAEKKYQEAKKAYDKAAEEEELKEAKEPEEKKGKKPKKSPEKKPTPSGKTAGDGGDSLTSLISSGDLKIDSSGTGETI